MAVNNEFEGDDVASSSMAQMEDLIAGGGRVGCSSTPMSFQEQLQQLKDDCFLELHDPNDREFGGIEATDVTSLLDQFEEVSESIADGSCYPVELDSETRSRTSIKRKESKATEAGSKSELANCLKPSPLLLTKLRNSSKRKSTIMLPMEKSSPKMETRSVKVNLKWPDLSKSALTDSSKQRTATEVNKALMQSRIDLDVNENYYESIGDHNSYCLKSPQSHFNSKCSGKSRTSRGVDATNNPGKQCVTLDVNANNEKAYPHQITLEIEDGELVDSNDNNSKQTMFKMQSTAYRKRNFRKREDSPEPDANYCDKIPQYFTALTSISKKRKINSSVQTTTNAITVEDFMDCDPSPSRDTSSIYSKLPAYHSCFTNSTKYDSSISSQESNQDKYAWERLRGDQLSVQSSSRSQSPLIVDVERVSRSRSRSKSHSRSRSRSKSIPKAYSMSRSRLRSFSSSSRSSSSDSSSSSRSRSSHRRSRRRRSRHRRRSSRSSRSSSSGSSRSSCRSRSYDRYRSRSRSLSEAREERRKELQQLRHSEKEQQMIERRIVYVGCIPNDYTRKQLRQRFSRFGDIEEVSVHFRDDGDNYGFVTFSYTCDAYAAIEKGNSFESEEKFDLCFGGRRKFCESEYADLDGNKETEEDFYPVFQKKEVCDFDALLKQVKTLAGKK